MEVLWMVAERATEADLFGSGVPLILNCLPNRIRPEIFGSGILTPQLYGFTNQQPQLSSGVQFQGPIGEMSFLAIFLKFLFACRIEIRFFKILMNNPSKMLHPIPISTTLGSRKSTRNEWTLPSGCTGSFHGAL